MPEAPTFPEALWSDIYRVFDPAEPASDPSVRAPRNPDYNTVAKMGALLRNQVEQRRFIVAGPIGSGKTTELLHVTRQLSTRRLVVYMDLWENLSSDRVNAQEAFNNLQTWELLGLLGLALVKAGQDRWGHPLADEPSQLGAALSAFQDPDDGGGATLDVAKLVKGLTVIAGGLVGATLAGPAGAAAGTTLAAADDSTAETTVAVLKAVGDAFTWKWKLGRRDRPRSSDQDAQVQAVLAAVNSIIQSLQDAYNGRIVLVVDGLDRVDDVDAFQSLFVESGLLRSLRCDLVVALHQALVDRFNGCPRQFDRRFVLANVPVADSTRPLQLGPGVGFFHLVAHRRLAGLEHPNSRLVFDSAVLDRLAWCSGGRLRDFMRLVRMLADEAMIEDRRVTDELVERVVNEARKDKERGVNKDQLRLLQEVLDDPSHELPGDDAALELEARQLLLVYPNKSEWYLPHTLLLLHKLKVPAAADSEE